MRKPVRLVGLMTGTALVAFLGSSCAENALFASRPDAQSASVVDRALNAARAARANGDLSGAASKLAYLVSIAPDNADVLSEYGKVLTEMGQPDEALVYFKKAMAENSDDWKIYNAEGVAYDEKHDFESASADYAKALKLNPASTAVLNNAARSRMMAGDLVDAEALLALARPTAQENGYFTSTQAQLSELELKSNPNAPVAALTPKMDVQAPAMPPAPAPTLPVEVHKAAPVASAAPRTIVASAPAPEASAVAQVSSSPAPAVVMQPAAPAPSEKDVSSPAKIEQQAATPQLPAVQTPTSEPGPVSTPAPAATAVASSSPAAAQSAAPPVPAQPAADSVTKTADAQTIQQTPVAAPVASPPVAAPVVEQAAASPAPTATPTPAIEKTEAAPAPAPQAAAATQTVEAKPVVEAPKPAQVAEAAKPAQAIEAPKSAPVIEQAKAMPAVEIAKTAPAAEVAPAAPAPAVVAKPVLSAAAMREAALEGWRAPEAAPQVTMAQTPANAASAIQPPQATPVTNAPSAANAEKLYIRIGMFRSRTHARHVARRLRPHDVHVTRVTWHGRHWYRVWIHSVGDRPQVQDELASVHSLGYLHARIIVKLETARHLAQSSVPTVVASSGR